MKKIFVDTSAWVALFDENDSLHGEAVKCLQRIKVQRCGMVISDYVFDESVTTTLARAGHGAAMGAGGFMLSSNVIELIWLDEELKRRAWEYFKLHADKGYSFTDCTSFVLMKELKLTHYLAFDKHFEQAGFRLFPK